MLAFTLQFLLSAGSQILPPVNDPTVGEAFLLVSFNTDSNNITYQLVADAVTELLVAHIHLPATSTMNGSVAIPLFQAQFDPVPGAATSGLIAAATVTPAEFVGPLEVLPYFDNVGVATVLSEYVQAGRAYAQVTPRIPPHILVCSQNISPYCLPAGRNQPYICAFSLILYCMCLCQTTAVSDVHWGTCCCMHGSWIVVAWQQE